MVVKLLCERERLVVGATRLDQADELVGIACQVPTPEVLVVKTYLSVVDDPN